MDQLQSHPRLFASRENLNRLHDIPDTPQFQAAWTEVGKIGDQVLAGAELEFNPDTHNSLLIRARLMQKRVVTLSALWWKTQQECYRAAVLQCVREISAWEYWSWIAMRKGETNPEAVYDLSCGENSATLAIAYDWLYQTLTPDERALFTDVAKRRAFQPFLHRTDAGQWNNFFGRGSSNWNAVCTGGTGMLALALLEELPEAAPVLARVEESLVPFMQSLETSGGGWPEGIGYWNYGMRYAFMYLRSWENAHGREHPLLKSAAVRQTLHFPLDFTPHGVACSFGDAGNWVPLPFHYAMAERFGDAGLVSSLDAAWNTDMVSQRSRRSSQWPDHAELLILHPRQLAAAIPVRTTVVGLYKGLDWGIFADRMPEPQFYAAVRGGDTKVPHSHRDLLSFHLVVGGEKLIENVGDVEYLDTTFSGRRDEIFEMTPASKNTLLINGVGIVSGSAVVTSCENYDGIPGIRMDATQAMGTMNDGPAALFCGRLFLLLNDNSLLLIDRVEVKHAARIEARFFSPGNVALGETSAVIRGEKQSLQMVFAATKPAVLATAQPPFTSPHATPRTLLRWCTRDITPQGVVFVTLLTANPTAIAEVAVSEDAGGVKVHVAAAGGEQTIQLTSLLLPTEVGQP